nr:MAG TPA: hypothetical protein [Caudoviricetes sp.]
MITTKEELQQYIKKSTDLDLVDLLSRCSK